MKKKVNKLHLKSKRRFCQKIIGTIEKPRLCVFRSHKHIYAQLIDDSAGHTVASSSTLPCEKSTASIEAAFTVGEALAKKAILKGITLVIFDRGNKPYAGRVKSLAEGSRSAGLLF